MLRGPANLRQALPRQASYNPALRPAHRAPRQGILMEAERINQIEGTVADLRGRLAALRRYL